MSEPSTSQPTKQPAWAHTESGRRDLREAATFLLEMRERVLLPPGVWAQVTSTIVLLNTEADRAE